jgi:DNA-directed RNA polymerase specialized sigma24 family protein
MKPDDEPGEDGARDRARAAEAELEAKLDEIGPRGTPLSAEQAAKLHAVYGLFFEVHWRRVRDALRKQGVPKGARDDLMQRCFKRFFYTACRKGLPENVTTRLLLIVRSLSWNLRRAKRRDPVSVGLPSSRHLRPQSSRHGTDRVLDLKRRASRLLHVLSPEHRAVADALLLRGLSHEEAAAELKLSQSTLASRLAAALKQLRKAARKLPLSQQGSR